MMALKKTAPQNPYLPEKARILESFRESPDNFSLKVDFKAKHEPGQFVMASLPGIGEAAISISSFSESHIKLDVRQVGSVTNSLARLRKGDAIFIRGPYGTGYPMKLLEGNNIIMIGGGCGVAPLKGVIEYIDSNREKYKNIDLFFGYRSAQDILFTRELGRWKQNHSFTLSIDKAPEREKEGEGERNGCYGAKAGFVTEHLKNAQLSNSNAVAFICGPPKMMELAASALKEKGFHSDQIFVSTERLMQCAAGKCGHCMIRGRYTCMDGPVFRLDTIEAYKND